MFYNHDMQKSIALVLALFVLWILASTYWYTCHIKYLCNSKDILNTATGFPSLSNFSLSSFAKPTSIVISTTTNNEINLPIHFTANLRPVLDYNLKSDFAKLINASKNGGTVLITGQNEPRLDGTLDQNSSSALVNQAISFLQNNGVPKTSIVVSTEGTIDSLSLTKYQFPNRQIILIIGDNNTK